MKHIQYRTKCVSIFPFFLPSFVFVTVTNQQKKKKIKGFGLFGHDPGVIPVPSAGAPHSYHDSDHSIYDHHFLHEDSAYKKTDAGPDVKAKLPESILTIDDLKVDKDAIRTSTKAPIKMDYTYFNVRSAKSMDEDPNEAKTDEHRRYDAFLHPTTATFKDKRIAGVSKA